MEFSALARASRSAAHAAEPGEAPAPAGLPREVAGALGEHLRPLGRLGAQLLGERRRLVLGVRGDDEELPTAHDRVALGLELLGELDGRAVARELGADLELGPALLARLLGLLGLLLRALRRDLIGGRRHRRRDVEPVLLDRVPAQDPDRRVAETVLIEQGLDERLHLARTVL